MALFRCFVDLAITEFLAELGPAGGVPAAISIAHSPAPETADSREVSTAHVGLSASAEIITLDARDNGIGLAPEMATKMTVGATQTGAVP
jgi:hypothetical protein